MEIGRIREILQSGNFDEFVGAEESAVLEVKSSPYNIDDAQQRYELAKDVSSLANAEGGYLLVGLDIGRTPDKPANVVERLTLIAQQDIDVRRYEGVIQQFLKPWPQVTVGWVARPGSTTGLGVIEVARQDTRKPFLIMKVVEDGSHLKQYIVGYARRHKDASDGLAPERLREFFVKGMDGVSQRLTGIEDKIDRLVALTQEARGPAQAEADTSSAMDADALDARIGQVIRDFEG
jgi:hypothetical protein